MSWATKAFAGMGVVLAVIACGSSDDSGGGGATCPDDNPDCAALATASAGSEAVVKRKCVDCHGKNMAGATTKLSSEKDPNVELYPPNLTPDKDFGVGTWTDDQLAVAIRTGIDNNSQQLCPQMKHFADMSDFEVFSIVKYLRSIPPVNQKVLRSVCPPFKTKDEQK